MKQSLSIHDFLKVDILKYNNYASLQSGLIFRLLVVSGLFLLQNVFLISPVFGQKSELRKAELLFKANRFDLALAAYNEYKKTDKRPDLLIKRGICFLKTNQPDECIKDMLNAGKLKSQDNSRYKYIGHALMSKGNYVDAAKYFKIYIAKIPRNSQEWLFMIDQIKKCGYARNGKYYPQIAFVENLGNKVNTKYDEFNPKQSPNTLSRYYFSASRSSSVGGLLNEKGLVDPFKGNYTADIYYTDLINGNWNITQSLGENINTPAHEIIQGFSNEGQIMYYIKKSAKGESYLASDTFAISTALQNNTTPINTLPFKPEFGDKDLYFFNDSTMLFSAIRAGGYGGYDLYFATRNNGFWALPVNLGHEINSAHDDVSPYLTKDGKTLFFSSNRNESYGGFDVFKSEYHNYHWTNPENVGMPINSPGDDLGFQVSTDGTMALMASDRITSIGGFDLYVCYFKDQIYSQFNIVENPDFIEAASLSDEDLAHIRQNVESTQKAKLPKKEIIVRPILFNEDEELLSTINLAYLKNLANEIVIYPNAKLIIQCHLPSAGKPESELFFSMKRAELVAEQLMKFGIKKENILPQGMGSNYPMVQYYSQNMPNRIAQSVNKRIDIRVFLEADAPLQIRYDWPAIPNGQIDPKWNTFQLTYNDTPEFRIVFAETTQMLKNELTSADNNVYIEKYPSTDKYLYSTGSFKTMNDALKAKNRLISHNIFNTTIIPYLNGIKMTEAQIKAGKDYYEELINYLNSNK